MGKKNGFAKQIVAWKDSFVKATRDTYEQYLVDTMTITLNEFGFGEQRIRKIFERWGGVFDEYYDVLTTNQEADYMQQKLDERIRQICKSGDFIPFEKRYEYLPDIKYDIRR